MPLWRVIWHDVVMQRMLTARLSAHRITKAGACRIAGISRPTLDAWIAS